MWSSKPVNFGGDDVTIIDREYIIRTGRVHFSFCGKESPENIFHESVRVPVFSVLKVNPNNPLRVVSGGYDHSSITPVGKLRMPHDVWNDKKVWRHSFFALLPFGLKDTQEVKREVLEVNDAFLQKDGQKGNAYLLAVYNAPLDFSSGDMRSYAFVSPSQVASNLFDFLTVGHRIDSSNGASGYNEHGMIVMPYNVARKVTMSIAKNLEKKLGTRLTFKELTG